MVGTLPSYTIADMSDGGLVRHTCGVATNDGHAICWGGDYCNGVSDVPTSGAYSFVTVGTFGSCAVTRDNAIALCWGCKNCGGDDKGQCTVSHHFVKHVIACACSSKTMSHMLGVMHTSIAFRLFPTTPTLLSTLSAHCVFHASGTVSEIFDGMDIHWDWSLPHLRGTFG